MKHLKIAYSFDVQYYFVDSDREIVPVEQTDFTDVAVAVISDQDFAYIDKIDETGFGIPIMVIMPGGEKMPDQYIDKVDVAWPAAMNMLCCRRFLPTSSITSVKRIRLLTARAIRTACFSRSIRQDAIFMISMDLIFFNPISVMPT
jgi:hypothetical protein